MADFVADDAPAPVLEWEDVRSDPQIVNPSAPDNDLLRGFRYVQVRQPDGTQKTMYRLLTEYDFLNPQEGDVMPKRPLHAQAEWDLAAMLVPFLKQHRPDLTVFNDLIMQWGLPDLDEPSPDFSVVPNVRDPRADRGAFNVLAEGTRPILVIEIVSPHYRTADREKKVDIYERVGIREYVILDWVRRRRRMTDEVIGYRLAGDRYRLMQPDEDGRLYCETVGLFIGLENGRAALWNGETGERLRNAEQAQAA
ncbi:MAG: Uma2 family endonuclease, partial [Chloroflexi bacterium]|nr:Uma2 family endonuclease [Chloroflexota bacterium]